MYKRQLQDNVPLPELVLDVPGPYQQHNVPGVLAVLDRLKTQYNYKISFENIQTGVGEVVARTGLRGRWQRLSSRPAVIADVAHNEDGLRALLAGVAAQPYAQLWIILGVVREKQLDRLLALLPRSARYVFTEPSVFRRLPAAELAEAAQAAGLRGPVIAGVNEALGRVRQQAAAEDLVLVCGSNFLVADLAEL